MRENKYDDAVFFQKYSEMDRSRQGLTGAGEWHELEKLLPDFQGLSVQIGRASCRERVSKSV